MVNVLRLYVLEQPEVEKVFNQPSFNENDSSTVGYKLEIKSHIKGFNFLEFWYMKQLPSENFKNLLFLIILVSIHFLINYFSRMNQRDEADAGISNLVFDVNNKERHPWPFSNSTVPSIEVILFVQDSIIVLMIILCFSMLFLLPESCEENPIWIALLSNLVGYILPNPKLWRKLFLLMAGYSCQLSDQVVVVKQSCVLNAKKFDVLSTLWENLLFLQIVPTTFQRHATSYTSDWVSKILRLWHRIVCLSMTIHKKKSSTTKNL